VLKVSATTRAAKLGSPPRHCEAHKKLKEREVFPVVEEVRRIALDKKRDHVYFEYGFDVLSAVPYEIFADGNFQSNRWPQLQALVVHLPP
jgi:hypothetical protein